MSNIVTGSLLALDTKFGWGCCLSHVGTEGREGKNDRRSIRTVPRALVEQRRARFTSSVAALRAALSAENGFEISAASLRL
jgi:hypothetical protein